MATSGAPVRSAAVNLRPRTIGSSSVGEELRRHDVPVGLRVSGCDAPATRSAPRPSPSPSSGTTAPTRRVDARKRREPVANLLGDGGTCSSVYRRSPRSSEATSNRIHREARIHVDRRLEGAQKQRRGHEQHETEGQLRGDEDVTQALAFGAPPALFRSVPMPTRVLCSAGTRPVSSPSPARVRTRTAGHAPSSGKSTAIGTGSAGRNAVRTPRHHTGDEHGRDAARRTQRGSRSSASRRARDVTRRARGARRSHARARRRARASCPRGSCT